jgi:hypothetical protein
LTPEPFPLQEALENGVVAVVGKQVAELLFHALDACPQHAQLLDQNLHHQHRTGDDGAVGGERAGGANLVAGGLELLGVRRVWAR